MNDLQIFNNPEFGEIRTLEDKEEVLFCAADVARALGYSNPRDAIRRHCKKGVAKHDILSNGGMQSFSFIPKGDVYRLISLTANCHQRNGLKAGCLMRCFRPFTSTAHT